MVLMYLIPGSGSSMTVKEYIIVGAWTLLGIIFYCICRNRYKEQFGSMS